MTLQIELDPIIEAKLTEEARTKGLDLQTYAGQLLNAAAPPSTASKPSTTVEQFRAMLDEFAKLGPKEMPNPEQTWPRSVIYADHD